MRDIDSYAVLMILYENSIGNIFLEFEMILIDIDLYNTRNPNTNQMGMQGLCIDKKEKFKKKNHATTTCYYRLYLRNVLLKCELKWHAR